MANFIEKVGSEILVNTTTQSDQYFQKITKLDGGGFVITWTDNSEQNGDNESTSVRAQVFDANGGKVGGEILANTTTESAQENPQIIALDGGGFVITWRDSSGENGDTSPGSVRAQVFTAGGVKSGGEILVNTTTANDQGNPQITALHDGGGGFVVSWNDRSLQAESGYGVRAQIFTAGGSKTGGEIVVNTSSDGDQFIPRIEALSEDDGGGFVVIWRDDKEQGGDTSGSAVRGQVFSSSGVKSGGEILVNTTTRFDQYDARITALESGFIVTWTDDSQQNGDISGTSVRAQVFGVDGSKIGSEILVNTATQSNQIEPRITALEGGGFVIAWSDLSQQNGDTSSYSVAAQIFDPNATKIGSQILVNSTTNNLQASPQITALDGGGFIVTWTDVSLQIGDFSGDSVSAQVFSSNGTKLGGEFLVNTTTNNNQTDPKIVALDDDSFVVTWTDYSRQNGDTSNSAIRAQVFQINAAAATADTGAMLANAGITEFDVRANDSPADLGTLSLPNPVQVTSSVSGLTGADVTASIVNGKIAVDLGADFDKLQAGDIATVTVPYTITDPNGDTSSANLVITVTGVNDAPYVQDKTVALAENGALGGNALDGVSDADGDAFTVVAINGATDNVGTSIAAIYGTLTVSADGTFTYVADNSSALSSGETATDSFTITVSDALGNTVTRDLDFNIAGSNDIITGTVGADVLTGTGGRDIMFGDAGNDAIDGNAGRDMMLGGTGDDTYTVDQFNDFIVEFENEGIDTVKSSQSWTLADNVENLTLLGSALNGTGNALANTITGNAENNILDGGAGNDRLIGGGGDDIYLVDAAGDVVTEAANQGTDAVYSKAVSYTLSANIERLVLQTGALNGTGNASNNVIIGNASVNNLDGGAGNDEINGGIGADNMTGGAGDDLFKVDNAGDTIAEQAGGGTDSVISTATSYTMAANVENLILDIGAVSGTGNAGNNFLTGNASFNLLDGGAGNDTLDGGAGFDQMTGGAGNDTFFVDDSLDVVNEALNGGTDEVRSSRSYTLGANVENLTLLAGALNGTGNGAANVIIGNAADNILNGMGGIDTLKGGFGNDSYYADVTGDVVTELASQGTDTVFSTAATYTLSANVENLTLQGSANIAGTGNASNNIMLGNSGNNTLDAGAGNDILDGGAGTDTLKGGAGNDQYFVNVSGDAIVELAAGGTDIVFSTAASYVLSANVENLTIVSGAGAANGTGNAANNIITGNEFANDLAGGDGNDTLDGGSAGADALSGGKGNDTYYVKHGAVTIAELANEGNDTIISSVASTGALVSGVENLILTVAGRAEGNSANNFIEGSGGNNIIVGAGGNDVMEGGGGADTFVFASGFGKDTVADFIGGTGGDRMQFDSSMFANEAAILAATTDTAAGLVITSGTNTVTLAGFRLDSYSAGDFFVV